MYKQLDIVETTKTIYKVGEQVFSNKEDAEVYISQLVNVQYYLVRSGADTEEGTDALHNNLLVKDEGTGGGPLNAQYIREYIRVLLGYPLFDWIDAEINEDTMILNYEFQKVDIAWVNKHIYSPTNPVRTILCLTDDPQYIESGITSRDEQGMRVIYIPTGIKKKDLVKVSNDILSRVVY